MDWIGQNHVAFLTGVPRCEPGDLARLVETVGLSANVPTRYSLVEHERWQLATFEEDALPQTPDRPALLRVLGGMLRQIAPTEELTIVDRYLFPKGCSECLDMITSLLSPVLPGGARVVLVTSRNCDEGLVTGLRERFKTSKVEVDLKTFRKFP